MVLQVRIFSSRSSAMLSICRSLALSQKAMGKENTREYHDFERVLSDLPDWVSFHVR